MWDEDMEYRDSQGGSEAGERGDSRVTEGDDWARYDSPSPTVYTPPTGERFYGSSDLDGIVERAPVEEPVDVIRDHTDIPMRDDAVGEEPIHGGGGDMGGGSIPIGEPDPGDVERIKEQDNEFFGELEGIVTDDRIEGMAMMLKSYAGIEIPTEPIKKIVPQFLPLLKKYGNRVFGGSDPEGFVAYSAEARKYAEFGKDIQPLVGSIIETLVAPDTDADGNVVLRPEDEEVFDNLEQDVEQENLSGFLRDEEGDGEDYTQQGVPADMSPRPVATDGRGGNYEVGAPDTKEKKSGGFSLPGMDELMAEHREKVGHAQFEAGMADAQRREEQMRAQPELTSYEEQVKMADKRNEDLRAQPALKEMDVSRQDDLDAQPALGKTSTGGSEEPSEEEIEESDIDFDLDAADFFDDNPYDD